MQNEKTPQDLLLVSDASDNKIKGVKGLSKNGVLQTNAVTKENMNTFLKVDRNGDFFSNFFTNFFSQLKNPTQFSFFRVPESLALSLARDMQKDLDQKNSINHELYLKHQVDPQKVIQSIESIKQNQVVEQKEYNPYKYNINDLDWDSLDKIGLSKEKLEEMDLLEPLLKGYKTKDLVMINLDLGSALFSLDARLSLKEQHGKVVVNLEGVKKFPNLNIPFCGHEFSKVDKHNLLKTGNMGRVVELLDPESKERIASVVSVDRITNNLAVVSVEKMQLPTHIKGVDLSQEQLQELRQGKAVLVKGMTSAKGNPFDAEIQYNASKGHIEFLFDNVKKSKYQNPEKDLKTFRGKDLTAKEQQALRSGETILVDGLIDKMGKAYKGYLSYDAVNNKTNFSFTDPKQKSNQSIVADIVPEKNKKTSMGIK
ncbi:DUF3945 domain-containing protein [Myroides injenensis]|uniref:DUF3945 domain-containing protein n=1 Tax=Myroides injenensis TaxID=1183151 RepID=UPI00227021EF|nr:DUF3945 domain-containing protein [Myroides injenensis]